MTHTLGDVRSLTRHFQLHQGLRFVPLGLLSLFEGLRYYNWIPWGNHPEASLNQPITLVVYVGLMVIFIGIHYFYKYRFGIVKQKPSPGWYKLLLILNFSLLFFFIYLDMRQDLPVNLTWMYIGIVLCIFGWLSGRLYGIALIGILCILFALIPAMGFNEFYPAFFIIHGAAFILVGIYYHSKLHRRFFSNQKQVLSNG